MMHSIKTLTTIALLLCLFLPLSQCTQEAPPGQTLLKDAKTTIYTPLEQGLRYDLSWQSAMPALVFILPFALLLLQNLRNDIQRNISGESATFSWFLFLAEFCSLLGLLTLLLLHGYLAAPLYGFFVAAVSSCFYFIVIVSQLFKR